MTTRYNTLSSSISLLTLGTLVLGTPSMASTQSFLDASDPSGRRALRLPAPQACHKAPTDTEDSGDEMAVFSSQGLADEDIVSVLEAFTANLYQCVPKGEQPNGQLVIDLTVGCNGRVSTATVSENDGLPESTATCVASVLRYAAFPAHDIPEGQTFSYPINFTW